MVVFNNQFTKFLQMYLSALTCQYKPTPALHW